MGVINLDRVQWKTFGFDQEKAFKKKVKLLIIEQIIPQGSSIYKLDSHFVNLIHNIVNQIQIVNQIHILRIKPTIVNLVQLDLVEC